MRGLLLLTLFAALIAGFMHQRGRLHHAEQVLAAHGLKWDLPELAEQEYRVTIQQNVDGEGFKFLSIRVQSLTAGQLVLLKNGQPALSVGLKPGEEGTNSGQLTVLADQFFKQKQTSKLDLILSADLATASTGMSGPGDDQGRLRFKLQAQPGVFKHGTAAPMFSFEGQVFELEVQ
ncbi:MAG: hypothetical protein SGJ19_26515 [Planctomycetia bacterium]|nr:hypothetical protein [Planctomycetia bacterium]